jgi:hypothetical protein
MKELTDLDVFFVSLTEAVDLSSPVGRAVARLLAVFANFEGESVSRTELRMQENVVAETVGLHQSPNTPPREESYLTKVYQKQRLPVNYRSVEPLFAAF